MRSPIEEIDKKLQGMQKKNKVILRREAIEIPKFKPFKKESCFMQRNIDPLPQKKFLKKYLDPLESEKSRYRQVVP